LNLKVLTQIIDLLYKNFLIPIILIDNNNSILHPDISLDLKKIKKFLPKNDSDQMVNFFSNDKFMFGSFDFSSKHKNYTIIFGPCGLPDYTEETFSFSGVDYIYGIHYTKKDKYSFEDFGTLLFSSITHQQLDSKNIIWDNSQRSKKDSHNTEKNLIDNLYERRMQDATFDSYQLELRLTEYVKQNKPEKVTWLINKMKETYNVELSPNKLEGLNFKFSAYIAVLTRLSIDEGVPVNQSFALSDALIQGLAEVNSTDEWFRYMKSAIFHFIEILHSYPYSKKTLIVKKIINYIDNHLHEKISLDTLSDITDRHKTHISAQFKKQTGQTIHSYILDRKIKEAKHFLLFTDYPYKEISTILAFSSQSHFIQVFKKITDLTPKEYKEKHFSNHI